MATITTPRVQPRATLADEKSWLEALAFRHGSTYDSYLATEPGRRVFWARNKSGAAAYIRDGRYIHIAGGLLAPAAAKRSLLKEILDWADSQRFIVSFYNLTDEDLPLVRELGFQVTKWGEEAVVDLSTCNWRGKQFEWVRRQTSFCRRQEVVVREHVRSDMPAAEWRRVAAELVDVSNAQIVTKPQRSAIRFLEGHFDPDDIGRRRLFVAHSKHMGGRVEAFLLCNPCLDGERWVFETYRRRPDAVRGAMPYLMHEAMQQLQSEGIKSVSLCLVPGLGCETPRFGDSPLVRWSVVIATRHFNFIHDTRGMYHYKSRFRPQFISRYVAVRPRLSLGSAWSFVRMLGVLDLHPGHLVRQSVQRIRRAAARGTLPNPALSSAAE